jgi:hypothetical protein
MTTHRLECWCIICVVWLKTARDYLSRDPAEAARRVLRPSLGETERSTTHAERTTVSSAAPERSSGSVSQTAPLWGQRVGSCSALGTDRSTVRSPSRVRGSAGTTYMNHDTCTGSRTANRRRSTQFRFTSDRLMPCGACHTVITSIAPKPDQRRGVAGKKFFVAAPARALALTVYHQTTA